MIIKQNISSIKAIGRYLFILGVVAILTGCGSAPLREPVPLVQINQAVIPDIPRARFWGDKWPSFDRQQLAMLTEDDLERDFSAIYKVPHNYLAISGGGANGAFGAGLLYGWSESGSRPVFTMVTGTSTGALTAPFAFLGEDYDGVLKELYTTTSTTDIVRERSLFNVLFSESVNTTDPLKAMIAKYIDGEVIEAIAREHRKGRRLYIGTVNLDAGRSVIWNIGVIAESNTPGKIELIHDVLRASAAIPVVFPPVMISVESSGKHYDEMHVDGGTGSQVFIYPAKTDWRKVTKKLKVSGNPSVYIIRNSFLDPNYEGIRRNLLPIASRTINSLIRTQGIGDLFQIHAICLRDGNDFNLAYIPSNFTEISEQLFDPGYMSKLFEFGYQMGLRGYKWKKYPPGFDFGTD